MRLTRARRNSSPTAVDRLSWYVRPSSAERVGDPIEEDVVEPACAEAEDDEEDEPSPALVLSSTADALDVDRPAASARVVLGPADRSPVLVTRERLSLGGRCSRRAATHSFTRHRALNGRHGLHALAEAPSHYDPDAP
jgi:hypothetical protein